MKELDYEQLTLFQEDSRASRFPLPGSEAARKMTVISGLKCSELYGNSDRLGCLVRMCLESSIWHSTRCLLTWKMKATPLKRSLFQLAALMPHIDGIGSQLWPTPSTGAALCGGTGNLKTLNKLAEKGYITEEERKSFSQGNGGKTNPALLEWMMGYEQKFTELIPTPTHSDYKTAPINRYWMPERDGIPRPAYSADRGNSVWENWPHEPGVDRVVDGIPNRVDRIKCLGNAVVPQQFYPFFAFIADIERRKNAT